MLNTFIFHEDPGHGWLEVPLSLIKELNIQNKISIYSYKDRDKAYLEEDCDFPVFFYAYQEKYGNPPSFERKDYKEDCFIRFLSHFK